MSRGLAPIGRSTAELTTDPTRTCEPNQQVIYHPYGGVSNRFDYRTFPAYGGDYNSLVSPLK